MAPWNISTCGCLLSKSLTSVRSDNFEGPVGPTGIHLAIDLNVVTDSLVCLTDIGECDTDNWNGVVRPVTSESFDKRFCVRFVTDLPGKSYFHELGVYRFDNHSLVWLGSSWFVYS